MRFIAITLLLFATAVAYAKPTFIELPEEPVHCPSAYCLYNYQATVTRWVDGDTVEMYVDLGFNIFTLQRFRLIDTEKYIDTPERGEPGYNKATEVSKKTAPVGTTMVIMTANDSDGFGRYFVYIPDVNLALEEAELLVDPYRAQ